jgi:hypothetical protein
MSVYVAWGNAALLLGLSLLGYLLSNTSEHLVAKAAAIPVGIINQIGLILLTLQIGCEFELPILPRSETGQR